MIGRRGRDTRSQLMSNSCKKNSLRGPLSDAEMWSSSKIYKCFLKCLAVKTGFRLKPILPKCVKSLTLQFARFSFTLSSFTSCFGVNNCLSKANKVPSCLDLILGACNIFPRIIICVLRMVFFYSINLLWPVIPVYIDH